MHQCADYSEHLDDELFILQTRSNSLEPITSRLSRVEMLTELYSMCLFTFQKKVEELGVFEDYSKMDERFLDPSVNRRSNVASTAREEISIFLRRSIFANEHFFETYKQLFPDAGKRLHSSLANTPICAQFFDRRNAASLVLRIGGLRLDFQAHLQLYRKLSLFERVRHNYESVGRL